MGATLDGQVQQTGAVYEAKFMLPWSFSEEAAADKHMAQLQHNMWVTAQAREVLNAAKPPDDAKSLTNQRFVKWINASAARKDQLENPNASSSDRGSRV